MDMLNFIKFYSFDWMPIEAKKYQSCEARRWHRYYNLWIEIEEYNHASINSSPRCFKADYYTFQEMWLYKRNTFDWYVIPRDKMKNITYGWSNDEVGHI